MNAERFDVDTPTRVSVLLTYLYSFNISSVFSVTCVSIPRYNFNSFDLRERVLRIMC